MLIGEAEKAQAQVSTIINRLAGYVGPKKEGASSRKSMESLQSSKPISEKLKIDVLLKNINKVHSQMAMFFTSQ